MIHDTKNLIRVVTAMILCAGFMVIVSVVQLSYYQARISVLITQTYMGNDHDIYAGTRTAEYVSKLFTRVIYSESFLQHVIASPYDINDHFGRDAAERIHVWRDTIEVAHIGNAGMIDINTYATDRTQAENLAQAVVWALDEHGSDYYGMDGQIMVRVVDGPVTSVRPARPVWWVNMIIGFVVGFVGTVGGMYFFDSKHNL